MLRFVGERRRENEASERGGTFAERLRGLRRAAGLTQEELASLAGLSPNAVGALERGTRRRPYPHTVRALADALGLEEEGRAALLAAVPKRDEDRTSEPVEDRADAGSDALPRPPTPLMGRERELEEVLGMLGRPGVRLLTLTGIGGVGKTRLALEAARASLAAEGFADGVAFAGLAPVNDPTLVVSTVARTMGLREVEGRTPLEVLGGYLSEKHLLLVLDNFEHVLDAAPEVAALVEACPRLVVLATSRAPLRVRGEQEYAVPPLALPPSTRNPTESQVLDAPSGRLFLERARAVSPDFAINDENAAAVAAICWRLAGLPLALELAAAKVRFLEPAELLPRLDRALSSAWARDLPERRGTMRAALDWSYDLLSEPERALFRRLSVFVGGFTLEAAEAVGAQADVLAGAEDVFELLGGLVEQSLVTAEATPHAEGGPRYGMLEPVRQYAQGLLRESGEAERVRRSHSAFYLELAERAAPGVLGPDQARWLGLLEREVGNLRAAISRALDAGEAETVARVGHAALQIFWWMRGHHQEGRRWMEAALAGRLSPEARLGALQVVAALSYAQGDYRNAEECWQEELRLAQQVGDEIAEGHSWAGLGNVKMARSSYEAAVPHFETALSAFERGGGTELPIFTSARLWLGTALLRQGEHARASSLFEEGLAVARRQNIPVMINVALYNLAQLALARGDPAAAAAPLEEGVRLSGQTKDRANLAHFLGAMSAADAFRGEAERSAVLLGAAERSLEEVGAPVYNFYAPDPSVMESALAKARAALGDLAFEEARTRGREMTFEGAIAYALPEERAPEGP